MAGSYFGPSKVFTWNPNTESDLAGYKFYAGASSRLYSVVQDVGLTPTPTNPSHPLSQLGLTDGQWYVAVSAYDFAGNESGWSVELPFVIDTVPPAAPTGLSAS